MQSRSIKSILKESFWMAIDSIRKNKLRSSLTLLGISIGVFSVIGVMTAIRTLESSVESGLNVFATNTFVIQKYPAISFGNERRKHRNRKNIDYSQYEKLKNRAQLPILVSVSERSSVRDVKYKDRTVKNSIELIGGDEGTVRCYNTYIADGRNFINEDIHHIRNVCILGMDVVDRLFPFEDPLGKRIHIDMYSFAKWIFKGKQPVNYVHPKNTYISNVMNILINKVSTICNVCIITSYGSLISTYELNTIFYSSIFIFNISYRRPFRNTDQNWQLSSIFQLFIL